MPRSRGGVTVPGRRTLRFMSRPFDTRGGTEAALACSSSASRLRLRLLPPPPGLHRGGGSFLGDLARQFVELGVGVEAGDLGELVAPLLPGLGALLRRRQLLPGEPLLLR